MKFEQKDPKTRFRGFFADTDAHVLMFLLCLSDWINFSFMVGAEIY